MGRRGPKPKPPHLKLLEGNPGRRTVKQRVTTSDRAPNCPARYSPAGRRIWRGIAKSLTESGVLTQLDTFALELLVDAEIDYQSALVNSTGPGDPVVEKMAAKLRTMLREFGLTPSSRSSVTPVTKEKKTADPAAQYFA